MKRQLGLLVVAAALAVPSGCASVGPPVAATPPPSPTLSATAPPTPPVTATPAPKPTAAAETSTATADPCASSTEDNPAKPPDVAIQPGQAAPAVTGRLGSFTYCDTAADALPPRAENLSTVALGDPPTISLAVPAGEGFVAYRAGYWPAAEWQGDEIALWNGTTSMPSTGVSLDAPPAGNWMLAVTLTFAGGGSAIYYWHVTVP